MVLFVTINSDIHRGNGKFSSSVYSSLKKMLGNQVYSVCIDSGNFYNESIYDECIEIKKRARLISGLHSIKQFLFGEPIRIDKKRITYLLEVIKKKSVTHVYLDESIIGGLAQRIKELDSTIQVTTCFHDIKKVLVADWMKSYGLLHYPYLLNHIRNERKAVKFSDNLITLNARDTQLLNKHYSKQPCIELPIIIDDEYITANRSNQDDKNILFVGTSYYPNVEGIRWFIEKVYPSVLDYKLIIVGNGMDAHKIELENKCANISVYGRVDSLASYYENASVVIAPIFKGGGMKVKVAEALMFGKIVVGTTEAFEGYDTREIIAVIANEPEDFVMAIKNFAAMDSFQEKNRMYYLNSFSKDAAISKLKKVFDFNESHKL